MGSALHSKPTTGERGQSFVEFALVLPVALIIFMGIIQFGILLSAFVGATNVAREVARYGSVCVVTDATTADTCGGGTLSYLNEDLPTKINAGQPATSGPNASSVCYQSYLGPDGNYNVRIIVAVGVNYPLFVPIIGNIIDGMDGTSDGFYTMRPTEQMRVEGLPLKTNPPLGTRSCP